MLTVHLLGYAHVTQNGRPVPLSAKAVALIAYLAIEKLPQHRERLADLLWNTAEARKNLRVELARIRSAGLNIFPSSRQLLYLEHVTTDLEVWQSALSGEMRQGEPKQGETKQGELSAWLAMLRGLPLSGLEDLGSAAFQEWVDQQRWVIGEQVERLLCKAYWRFARDGQLWATRLIAARAEALGFENPAESVPDLTPEPEAPIALTAAPEPEAVPEPQGDVLWFERPAEERALRLALERAAARPQLVVLHGPAGSGKSDLVGRLAAGPDGLTVQIPSSRSGRLVLATIAQALLAEPSPIEPPTVEGAGEGGAVSAALGQMLLSPASLEEDVVKVAVALSKLRRPLVLVLDHAQSAPVELASLIEFLLGTPACAPRLFVLLSRARPADAPLCRSLLRRVDASRCLELEMPPLSQSSVRRALEACFPFEQASSLHLYAARLLQRSEGNPLHLLGLLGQERQEGGEANAPLPPAVRDAHAAELEGWPAALREAMGRLSVVNGSFDHALARAVLGAPPADSVQALLCAALERRILVEAEAEAILRLPDFSPDFSPPEVEPRYLFRSEGLRVTLAAQLTQLVRQDVRRRLVPALAEQAPGLALYYAERAGLGAEVGELRQAYRARLGQDSPLLASHALAPQLDAAPHAASRPAPEPRRGSGTASAPVARQGHLLSFEGGWLNIVGGGHYGHARTLRLHLPLPGASAKPSAHGAAPELRITWRLDVFGGGVELGPLLAPFALRLCALGGVVAHVLTPKAPSTYREDGVRHLAHEGVGLGHWMEHRVKLSPDEAAASTLELSVRALDVALTIGELSWNGHPLLPLQVAPERVPESMASRGGQSGNAFK